MQVQLLPNGLARSVNWQHTGLLIRAERVQIPSSQSESIANGRQLVSKTSGEGSSPFALMNSRNVEVKHTGF